MVRVVPFFCISLNSLQHDVCVCVCLYKYLFIVKISNHSNYRHLTLLKISNLGW